MEERSQTTPWWLWLYCGVLSVALFASFAPFQKYRDSLKFAGDEWMYQSLAVNFAGGHGIMIQGQLEPFEMYHIDVPLRTGSKNNTGYDRFLQEGADGGVLTVLRSPGYPFILGMFYWITQQTRVDLAKYFNLAMLCLASGLLPIIAFHFWKIAGLISSPIAGVVYMNFVGQKQASVVMSEPLISLTIVLMVLALVLWEQRPSWNRSILLGLSFGASLMIKGTMIFLMPFFLGYEFYRSHRNRLLTQRFLWRIGTMVILAVLPVTLWSISASYRSDKVVVIARQSFWNVLNSNNELALRTGNWTAKWADDRTDQSFVYNRPEVQKLPGILQVAVFYKTYWKQIPLFLYRKIHTGFSEYVFLKIALMGYIFEWAFKRWKHRTIGTYALFVSLIVLSTITAFVDTNIFVYAVPAIVLAIVRHGIRKADTSLPVPFALLLLNFFTLVVILSGNPRHIQAINLFFVLTAVHFLVLGGIATLQTLPLQIEIAWKDKTITKLHG
jgi:4-amino-4-deoxy-L-arabinose transferase-like glycosyltransferase